MDREKKSTMSTGRISNEHHYACKEIVAERDALRSQVSALQAENQGLRKDGLRLDKLQDHDYGGLLVDIVTTAITNGEELDATCYYDIRKTIDSLSGGDA